MPISDVKIKVSSKSFSRHPILRKELLDAFPHAEFNEAGVDFDADGFVEFIDDSAGIIVGLEPISEHVLSKCPNLKYTSKFGVGLDNVDYTAAEKYSVQVGWTGGVNRRSVSEMALCFMIGLSRQILFSARNLVDENDWTKNGGFDLSNKTIGIIGVGYIGKDLIHLLKPFGSEILVNDIIDQSQYYNSNGLTECSKEEIFSKADIVTVHTSLNETTRSLFDKTIFKKMKETAYFVNCARGGVVVQDDLKQALLEGEIAGAAIDVFDIEPCDDREFIELPNLISTPHTGGSSNEAILAMGRSAIFHLTKYFDH